MRAVPDRERKRLGGSYYSHSSGIPTVLEQVLICHGGGSERDLLVVSLESSLSIKCSPSLALDYCVIVSLLARSCSASLQSAS